MPNVDVPPGADPLIHVWTALAPKLASAAGGYSSAVYEHSSLSLREFEAAPNFYELQIYPSTPIGSYTLHGVSVDALVKQAHAVLDAEVT